MVDLSYPIGKFDRNIEATPERRAGWIRDIAQAPARLREAVRGLSDAQLDTPYRPDGWTVRQVVHHLADSHMHAYARFRLAVTENEPTIKPYDEKLWAELADARSAPVDLSLTLVDALHQRWALFLQSLSETDFGRKLRHPEIGLVVLGGYLGSYAWHSRHHVAHITSLRERMGWS
jgi:uncharacterized damage-inducible protein DinB